MIAQINITGLFAAFWVLVGLVSLLYVINLPCYFRLRGKPKVCLNGVCDINDAVKICLKTSLRGVELAEFARDLVYNKMTPSRRNTLESPRKAFMRGKGSPVHYTYALKEILSRLGFEATPVYSTNASLPDVVIDENPLPRRRDLHVWLLVNTDGGQISQCAYYNIGGKDIFDCKFQRVGIMKYPIIMFLLFKNISEDNRAEKGSL